MAWNLEENDTMEISFPPYRPYDGLFHDAALQCTLPESQDVCAIKVNLVVFRLRCMIWTSAFTYRITSSTTSCKKDTSWISFNALIPKSFYVHSTNNISFPPS